MKPRKIPDTDLYMPPPLLYCGPTALCTITGLHYQNCIRPVINEIRGRAPNRGVTGMKNSEMVRVLAQLGWRASPLTSPLEVLWRHGVRPRLPDALRYMIHRGDFARSDIILVETTRHYVTVQNNVVVDNHAIDSLIRHPARRQLAKRAWHVAPLHRAARHKQTLEERLIKAALGIEQEAA